MAGAEWLAEFSGLSSLDDDARETLRRSGRVVEMPAGRRIFGPGQAPDSFLLLLTGSVRVHQISESGREIVLYRVSAGESCALTTACLLGYDAYGAEGIAETDIRAVAIPRSTFDELVSRSAQFRRFVFMGFSRRMTDLFRLIEEVAFQRLDIRLAGKLLERSQGGATIDLTHQELAAELGTAREVVSRQLQELQRRGWILPGRGHIEIKDRTALERLAAA
ncbi:MAG: Crp/Fnr family transcriptional regulator [Hyphomicrobiaceae bacterium]|nr:Crp/Fnr family transcriptional regulator [Hyphomicrobiaceae bacterium]